MRILLFAALGVRIKPARCLGARRFWNIVCQSRGRNKAGAIPGRAPVLEYCILLGAHRFWNTAYCCVCIIIIITTIITIQSNIKQKSKNRIGFRDVTWPQDPCLAGAVRAKNPRMKPGIFQDGTRLGTLKDFQTSSGAEYFWALFEL